MARVRGQAYGQDLRDRVLAAEGSIREVAERFVVSDSYVARVRSKRRRLGEDRAGVQCGHVPLRLARVGARAGRAGGGRPGPDAGAVVQLGSARARRARGHYHHVEDAGSARPEL